MVGLGSVSDYDRRKELQEFDDSKTGVKGLVDSKVGNIPRIFIRPPEEFHEMTLDSNQTHFQIPVIDLQGIHEDSVRRVEVVNRVKEAAETTGFFQVVNHGIPLTVLEQMLQGIRRFNEQETQVKKQYYSRDITRKVRFNSNFDLFKSKTANWRDTLLCVMAPHPPNPEELPLPCREIMMEYSKQVNNLGLTLFKLLSEALGLNHNHLGDMGCTEGHVIISHYYPACPEPDLTLGISKHSDSDFFTVLLQDSIGGLQVLHQNQWVDIPPVDGALVINIGDLLQLISNDRFKSSQHRVLANYVGPRVSVACFFCMHLQPCERKYGPIKELLSEDIPALYRETTETQFVAYYNSKGLGGQSALEHFRL
ncbi:hypothetical protein NE237_011488 [Protea cynaroides]|uniref:Fe2OG dioxygenase domain-containing protein n=1 Tax=Protea cynaroides TaxID=273540 RepID=A0A9Q0GW81_9MAGN|nr:hypothetical protein NE237_011488 [Protea cynaroides]